jgi:cyclohexadienyl dehydratase
MVLERGELRVGTTGDYKPFSLRNDKSAEFEGIDIDLAHSLAGALGVRLRLVQTSWPTLLADLLADHFDLAMGGISISLERQKRAFYSTAYLVSGKAAIARCADKKRYIDLDAIDQPGVRVIVNPGGTNHEFVRAHIRHATVIVSNDNRRIFEEIAAGRADVMITDGVEVELQTALRPSLCPAVGGKRLNYVELGYLLPRGDVLFKAFVDQWLHLAMAEGEVDRAYRRWMEHYGKASK